MLSNPDPESRAHSPSLPDFCTKNCCEERQNSAPHSYRHQLMPILYSRPSPAHLQRHGISPSGSDASQFAASGACGSEDGCPVNFARFEHFVKARCLGLGILGNIGSGTQSLNASCVIQAWYLRCDAIKNHDQRHESTPGFIRLRCDYSRCLAWFFSPIKIIP